MRTPIIQTRKPRVTEHRIGPLTQGSIFTGGIADQYSCDAFGIIITARCDLEQSKVPAVHYLPIVPIGAWLQREAGQIIHKRESKDIEKQITNTLQSLRISPAIHATLGTRVVLENRHRYDHIASVTKQASKHWERLAELSTKEELLAQISSNSSTNPMKLVSDLASTFEKTFRRVIQELITQRLSGFYYLSDVWPVSSASADARNSGYVVLLREPRLLPIGLAESLSTGFDHVHPESSCPLCKYVSRPADGFCWPISIVRSPDVEHLIQTFSLLFYRIGIEDEPDTAANEIITRETRQERQS